MSDQITYPDKLFISKLDIKDSMLQYTEARTIIAEPVEYINAMVVAKMEKELKALSSGELASMYVSGQSPSKEQALAIYAEPANWMKVYADNRCYWAWVGPVIVGYELAQNTLKKDFPHVR